MMLYRRNYHNIVKQLYSSKNKIKIPHAATKIKDSTMGDSMCWNKKLEQPDKYINTDNNKIKDNKILK